jgi:GT2 family glycosyltransferase
MIHVLTLTWNGLDKLKELRPGLMKNLEKTGMPFMWYVKDNGSKDGTVEEVKTWENTVVYDIGHNRDNFAQGINFLASQTKCSKQDGDYYLFMNNDIVFGDDDSLSKMLMVMVPEVSMVGCRLLYKGTDKLQHAGVIFSERYGNMPYHYRHQETSDAQAEKNRHFQAVTAAVTLARCSDFDAVNGMDEQFHWAFEDIDLCLRIGKLGRKIVYCGETKIFHEESASLKKNPVNKLFMGSNVAHFKSKWLNKYHLDHTKYLQNPSYNEIK